MKIKIVYEDADLLVVSKPPGVLSVPGKGSAGQNCLATYLAPEFTDLHIVHRLDMATSGLMVIARHATAQKHMNRQFAERRVSKQYTAMVEGEIQSCAGEICVPLICDWPNRPRQMVCFKEGKASLTRFQVLKRHPHDQTTRVRLTPVTGRSHQLRVHMQWLGHPILGDEFYGTGRSGHPHSRMLLHAEHLSFLHPTTRQIMSFSDPAMF